jgi:hypothetical protein
VINHLVGEYECKDDILRVYHEEFLKLLREFKIVNLNISLSVIIMKIIGWPKGH